MFLSHHHWSPALLCPSICVHFSYYTVCMCLHGEESPWKKKEDKQKWSLCPPLIGPKWINQSTCLFSSITFLLCVGMITFLVYLKKKIFHNPFSFFFVDYYSYAFYITAYKWMIIIYFRFLSLCLWEKIINQLKWMHLAVKGLGL